MERDQQILRLVGTEPRGHLSPAPWGQSCRSSWKGNYITREGWVLASWPESGIAFLPSFCLDHCPVSFWAEGLSVIGRKGASSVSLQGLAGSS